MTIDINELRRLAQAATPGPWINHGRQPNVAGLPHSAVAAKTLLARVYSEAYGDVEQETANAAFIAAANPTTIEALLDRIQLLEQEKATLMGILHRAGNTIEALDGTSVENERLVDDYHSALSICSGEGGIPVGAISTLLSQAMEVAGKNGANSVSMPDEYVEIAAWLCGVPGRGIPDRASTVEPAGGE